MINKLVLHSIEAHKDSSIDFSPGVNLIIGPSDNGKSSIIKALRWIITNRPSGSGLIRRGTDGGRATVFVDGHKIYREMLINKKRSPTANRYGIDETVYNAVSTNVPKEVSDLLNLDEVNIQSQFDQFFLLDDSPGEVARAFNQIMGLDIIDNSLKEISTRVQQSATHLELCINKVADCKKQIEELPDTASFESALILIDEHQKECEILQRSDEHVRRLLKAYREKEFTHNKACDIAQAHGKVAEVIKLLEFYTSKETALNRAKSLLQQYRARAHTVAYYEQIRAAERRIDSIDALLKDRARAEEKVAKYGDLLWQYSTRENTVAAYARISSAERSLDILNTLLKTRAELEGKASRVGSLLRTYRHNAEKVLNVFDFDVVFGKIKGIEKLAGADAELAIKAKTLSTALFRYRSQFRIFKQSAASISCGEDEYNKLKSELGVCPVCEKSW